MTTTESIPVFINGDNLGVPTGCNVFELLKFLNIAPDRVAVELNKTLVRKRDWETTLIGEGARLEVVEFVGGG